MKARAALVLLLVAPLAGCAESSDGLMPLRSGATLPEPYYHEHRATLDAQHLKDYRVDVIEGATLLNVTLHLESRHNGLPLPGASVARVKLSLLAPDGSVLQTSEADAQNPTASLVLAPPHDAGTYVARVEGAGASGQIDGSDYGASYLLSLEVLYT